MGTWFRRIRQIGLIIGLLLGFTVCIELLHAYTVLNTLAPWLGSTFAFLIAVGLMALLGRMLWTIRTYPVILHAPPREETAAYARYLASVSRHLGVNSALDDATRAALGQVPDQLQAALAGPDADERMTQIEQTQLTPAIEQLDTIARARVQAAVRDVMVGVTLSP